MTIRVKRKMQKVRWPSNVKRPSSISAPGLRLTFTGDEPRDTELSLFEAQLLITRIAVKFLGKVYDQELELEGEGAMKPGDEILAPESAPESAPEK